MNEIVIIGNSKASSNLSNYLKISKIKHKIIPYRKLHLKKNELKKANIVFILTKDDEIEKIYKKHKQILFLKKLFHFSGATTNKHITSIHPISSFSKKPITKKEFESIIFSSENPKYIKENLKWFKNRIIKLKPSKKPYYHALLSIYFNFPLILIREMSNIITKEFNIPYNYLKKSFIRNFEKYKKTGEITGPIERNDVKTINKHLKSLKGDNFFHLYKEMLKLVGRKNEYN